MLSFVSDNSWFIDQGGLATRGICTVDSLNMIILTDRKALWPTSTVNSRITPDLIPTVPHIAARVPTLLTSFFPWMPKRLAVVGKWPKFVSRGLQKGKHIRVPYMYESVDRMVRSPQQACCYYGKGLRYSVRLKPIDEDMPSFEQSQGWGEGSPIVEAIFKRPNVP